RVLATQPYLEIEIEQLDFDDNPVICDSNLAQIDDRECVSSRKLADLSSVTTLVIMLRVAEPAALHRAAGTPTQRLQDSGGGITHPVVPLPPPFEGHTVGERPLDRGQNGAISICPVRFGVTCAGRRGHRRFGSRTRLRPRVAKTIVRI